MSRKSKHAEFRKVACGSPALYGGFTVSKDMVVAERAFGYIGLKDGGGGGGDRVPRVRKSW